MKTFLSKNLHSYNYLLYMLYKPYLKPWIFPLQRSICTIFDNGNINICSTQIKCSEKSYENVSAVITTVKSNNNLTVSTVIKSFIKFILKTEYNQVCSQDLDKRGKRAHLQPLQLEMASLNDSQWQIVKKLLHIHLGHSRLFIEIGLLIINKTH